MRKICKCVGSFFINKFLCFYIFCVFLRLTDRFLLNIIWKHSVDNPMHTLHNRLSSKILTWRPHELACLQSVWTRTAIVSSQQWRICCLLRLERRSAACFVLDRSRVRISTCRLTALAFVMVFVHPHSNAVIASWKRPLSILSAHISCSSFYPVAAGIQSAVVNSNINISVPGFRTEFKALLNTVT